MKKFWWIIILFVPMLHAQGVSTLITHAQLDSALAAWSTNTNTKQLIVKNDTLVISDTASGKAQFTGTDTVLTIVASWIDSLDVILVTPEGNASNNVLSVYPSAGTFDVRRLSTGAISGLKFNYFIIKRY